MARLYNDSLFLYNASDLSYDGVVTFARTATGSGVGTESASRIRVPVRTATGSGTGTQTASRIRVPVRTATGSGAGTETANWNKSLIFRTPVEDRFPWDNYRNSEPAHRLFAKADQGYRARNIFRLTNGTYTNTDPLDPTLVARTYYGGHDHFVTQTEKDELVAAGYTVT